MLLSLYLICIYYITRSLVVGDLCLETEGSWFESGF